MATGGKMLKCRDCEHWITIGQWQGNCEIYNWRKPKWGQDASAYGCKDYKDRQGVLSGVTNAKE